MARKDGIDKRLCGTIVSHVEGRGIGLQPTSTQIPSHDFERVCVAAISYDGGPASASPSAMANPRPREAPVMSATRSSSENNRHRRPEELGESSAKFSLAAKLLDGGRARTGNRE